MYSDYSITESIPVSDHVYKYLLKKCGTDTYVANRSELIGNIVLSSLGTNPDISISKIKFKKTFNVVIKDYQYLKAGISLGIKSGQVFNKMMDKMFREELYCHIYINSNLSKDQYLEGIRNFLNVYEITEDDIKLESIYRDFKRKKETLKSRLTPLGHNKITPILSPKKTA